MNRSPGGPVTLADVLRLVLPLNTEVVGERDLGRPVNWVTVLTELNNLRDQIQPGDIVILPKALQAYHDDLELATAVPLLAKLKATALLTFLPVSDLAVQMGADSRLPIIVVLGDSNLRDIHQDIAGLLVDKQKQIVARGMQLYRKLTEMSREGQGLLAMTEVMSRLTGKIVAVQDKRLEFQALVAPSDEEINIEVLRQVLKQDENLPVVLQNRKAAAKATQNHWQQTLTVGDLKAARLISPIISGDRARGYLSVVGGVNELDMLDVLTAEHGAAACSLEMAKAKAISETRKALRGDFLEGLLAGTLPEDEIQRLAGRLDHDTSRPHAILALCWDGPDAPSLRRLETPLNWLLSRFPGPALTHIYSDDHVGVFKTVEEDRLDVALELASKLRDHLQLEFPQALLISGVSGPANSLEEWPEVYNQAVQAMTVAGRLRSKKALAYRDLGVYQILSEIAGSAAAYDYCQNWIGSLAAYDAQHGSNLIQTLIAYFEHRGNISQTAEALFVHRNTLHYRLDRIQKLTGQDLNQADERLALQVALKLWAIQPPGSRSEAP